MAHKLVLLADKSVDWPYAFIQLNDAISTVPLLSKGHVSAMRDGAPSVDALGWLHQLQICKLLQHKDMVVCPEGLNGELEALQFTCWELPLWDTATPSKPIHKPQLIEVDHGSVQPESITTAVQAPTTIPVLPLSPVDTIDPPHDIAMAINLQFMGALEQLQQASQQPQPLSPRAVCQGKSCH